jgi:hypothetical protein
MSLRPLASHLNEQPWLAAAAYLQEAAALIAPLEQEWARQRLRQQARAATIWRSSRPVAGTAGERYLARHGIRLPVPSTVRFHPSLEDYPDSRPGLVALVTAGDGAPLDVQRTFLRPDGTDKAAVEFPGAQNRKIAKDRARELAEAGQLENSRTASSSVIQRATPVTPFPASRDDHETRSRQSLSISKPVGESDVDQQFILASDDRAVNRSLASSGRAAAGSAPGGQMAERHRRGLRLSEELHPRRPLPSRRGAASRVLLVSRRRDGSSRSPRRWFGRPSVSVQ